MSRVALYCSIDILEPISVYSPGARHYTTIRVYGVAETRWTIVFASLIA